MNVLFYRSNVNLQLNADPMDVIQSPISRIEETVNQIPLNNQDSEVK